MPCAAAISVNSTLMPPCDGTPLNHHASHTFSCWRCARSIYLNWNENSDTSPLVTPYLPLLFPVPGLGPLSVKVLLFLLRAASPWRAPSPSYVFVCRLLFSIPCASHCLPPILSATGGAALKRRPDPPETDPSSSTKTIIHTPTAPLWPKRGVQWIHRGRPSPSPASSARVSHRILAVTPLPSPSAARRSERTRVLPPMRLRKGD